MPKQDSTSIGKAQHAAALLWADFITKQGFGYVDVLELCAVLIINVADKTQNKDAYVLKLTNDLISDMRLNTHNKTLG